jgi:hypothetical protein
MVGRTVHQYQFVEKLGSGGMGEIFKAQDTRLNRFVAIKILPAGKSGDPERRRRFIQEAQAASALNHPNIITIHDIVSDGETQYMVMEYVAGKTLLDLIPSGGMRVAQVLQYATQMADALTTAHAAGIIHRDFKPANVMVTGSGLVKVLDFGLAKLTERSPASQFDPDATASEAPITVEGSIMGTVSYMSPEQAEGKRVDARSDIFSFGSVLYEMVTGRRAFHGDSGISTLTSVLRDDAKPISELTLDVPPLLEVIIARCLNKDPDGRWQSMKEVGDALNSLRRTLDSGVFDQAAVAAPVAAAAPVTPAAPVVPAVPVAASGPVTPVTKVDTATPVTSLVGPAAEKSKSSNGPIFAFLGFLLLAGAGAGGWWWWNHRQPAVPPVAQITPPVTTAPAPTEAAPPPAPVAETPAATTPAPTIATPAATSAKKTKAAATQPPAVTKATPQPAAPVKAQQEATPAPKVTRESKAAPRPPVVPAVPVTVADSLPFYITLDEDVPADATGGQTVSFTVRDGLKSGDTVVVAKGARVSGSIVGEVGKKILGIGSKKMNFRLMQADAVDGQKLNVRATAGHTGKGPASRAFDTGKGSKSKELAAAKGTEYIGYTDGEQTVSVRK